MWKTNSRKCYVFRGPLTYLDTLRERFVKTLNLKEDESIIPENAHLFVAYGAILENKNSKIITYEEIQKKILSLKDFHEQESTSLTPLFKSQKELTSFQKRHAKNKVVKKELKNYSGKAFLGIDAGSTTAKLVLIDENGAILYEDYQPNLGTPVNTLKKC